MFTKKKYDECYTNQEINQKTAHLPLVMDLNKYVNCNNLCKQPNTQFPQYNQLIDIESSLMGLDRPSSNCNNNQYPLCASNGCLLTNDNRIPQFTTPYVCERGRDGEKAVVTTNMKLPTNSGINNINTNPCGEGRSTYQSSLNFI